MKRKKLLLIVLTFLGLVSAQWATAQNVTIGPNNGSLITGQAGGNVDDSGIQRGMGADTFSNRHYDADMYRSGSLDPFHIPNGQDQSTYI